MDLAASPICSRPPFFWKMVLSWKRAFWASQKEEVMESPSGARDLELAMTLPFWT